MQIRDTKTDEELREVCLKEEYVQFILDSGYSRPLSYSRIGEKPTIMSVVAKHYALLRNKAEIDQLQAGLTVLGVGKAMSEHPDLMKPLFVYSNEKAVSAGM